MTSPRLVAVMCAAFAATACDQNFSPIEPSELQFSVFGYLDASADTQWIRVMPLRALVPTSPGSLGATVTLEHLRTGRVTELRDSVFRFSQLHPDLGSDGVYVHNFWTTQRIEPGAAYRFAASWDGVRSSETVVQIPPEYDVEVWLRQPGSPGTDLLRLSGLNHVGLAQLILRHTTGCVESHLFRIPSADSDVHMIPITARPGRLKCEPPSVETRELLIVGSGAPWPSGPESSAFNLGVPDVPSNVSYSVGFLGGVLTHRIAYPECQFESSPHPDYCRLRYGGGSVTLRGTIRDLSCSGEAVPFATVRLREIDPDPSTGPKVRTSRSNRSGEYEMRALEPGRRYALSVHPAPSPPLQQYEEHTDRLEFAPGVVATYDVGLRRAQCGP